MVEKQAALSQLTYLSSTDLDNPIAIISSGLALEDLVLRGPPFEENDLKKVLGVNLERLQQLYERFETNTEIEFAQRVLDGNARREIDYPLYARFKRLIQAEIDLAGIKPSDKILFIGSGPFPISAMLFSQLASVSVDCYDKSPEACETSQKVVNSLGFADKIHVFNDSGETGRVYDYSVIIVALLAKPKQKIMSNIWFHAPPDVKVICRTTDGTRQAFYEGVQEETLTGFRHFKIIDQHRAGKDDTISSLFTKIDRIERYP